MQSQGLFPRIKQRLFGSRPTRLKERLGDTHILSYLLVCVQSATAVLVLGHTLLALLASNDWLIRGIAALALFILISSVVAADLAVLRTFRRIPALARNRQRFMLWEHVCYVLFVMVVEGLTYSVVLAQLDTNPRALLSSAPILPATGWMFTLQIALRTFLLGWTSVQLLIIAGKLAPQLTTLLNTGKEIVGAHVEHQLTELDLSGASLAASFGVYAAMSKPPRRIRTLLNGWLVKRDAHREAEEERQSQLVIDALTAFERARLSELNKPSGLNTSGAKPLVVTTKLDQPVTTKTDTMSRPKREPVIRLIDPNPKPKKRTKLSAEDKVRKVIDRYGDVGPEQIAKLAKVSRGTARKYREVVLSEQRQTVEVAVQ